MSLLEGPNVLGRRAPENRVLGSVLTEPQLQPWAMTLSDSSGPEGASWKGPQLRVSNSEAFLPLFTALWTLAFPSLIFINIEQRTSLPLSLLNLFALRIKKRERNNDRQIQMW